MTLIDTLPAHMLDDEYAKMLKAYLDANPDVRQLDIAKMLKVSQATINRWLNGVHGVSRRSRAQIKALCKGYSLAEESAIYSVDLKPQTVPLVTQMQAVAMNWNQGRIRELCTDASQQAMIPDPSLADCIAIRVDTQDEDSDIPAGHIVFCDPCEPIPATKETAVLVVLEDPETRRDRIVIRRHVLTTDSHYILNHLPGVDGDDVMPVPAKDVRFIWRMRGAVKTYN